LPYNYSLDEGHYLSRKQVGSALDGSRKLGFAC
jgi:hypothetical protein